MSGRIIDWALRDDAARATVWTAPLVTRLANRLARDCAAHGWRPRCVLHPRLTRAALFGDAVTALVSAYVDEAPIGVDAALGWWIERLLGQLDLQDMGQDMRAS